MTPNPKHASVIAYICTHPGCSAADLNRDLGYNHGQVAYHLARRNNIRSVRLLTGTGRWGSRTLFYPITATTDSP